MITKLNPPTHWQNQVITPRIEAEQNLLHGRSLSPLQAALLLLTHEWQSVNDLLFHWESQENLYSILSGNCLEFNDPNGRIYFKLFPERFDDLVDFPILARAIEIAMVGNHTVNVTFGLPIKQGNDINIELQPIRAMTNRKGEDNQTVLARIEKAKKQNTKPVFCQFGKQLWEAAKKQLTLTDKEQETIKGVALSIAKLSGSDIIQAVHLCEAVQYSQKSLDIHKMVVANHTWESRRI